MALIFSLTSTQKILGGQRHAPAAFPTAKIPDTHFTAGCVVPDVGLDGCGKSRPTVLSIPGPPKTYRFAIISKLIQRKVVPYTGHKVVWNGWC